MSFAAYPAYRDSGMEWIGPIPTGWKAIPLKRDLEFLTSGSRGWADHYAEAGALFLRIGNLTRDSLALDLTDVQRVAVPTGSEGERTRVRGGDVLFSITAFMGSVAIVPNDLEMAYVSQHVALARLVGKGLVPRWVGYVTLSAAGKAYLDAQCYGGTKIQLSLDDVANLPLPMPPLSEQHSIVNFLDHETAKIDALVAEQERLIALLKENRQAVISHAVTKGLNPNASMKDSGVEWLGQVPAHWEVRKLRSLAQPQPAAFTNGPFGSDLLTSELQDQGVPVIYIRDLNADGYSRSSNSFVTTMKAQQLDKFRVDPFDVLIAKVGDPPGFCCTYPDEEPAGIVCQDVIRLKPDRRVVSPFFICFLLNSGPGMEAIDSICVELTRKRFSLADLHSLRMFIPPLPEQIAIAQYLHAEAVKFAALISEATRAITLLRERRAALISAAVTGKIDVRGFVRPDQQAA